jgi:hypothetical protein
VFYTAAMTFALLYQTQIRICQFPGYIRVWGQLRMGRFNIKMLRVQVRVAKLCCQSKGENYGNTKTVGRSGLVEAEHRLQFGKYDICHIIKWKT